MPVRAERQADMSCYSDMPVPRIGLAVGSEDDFRMLYQHAVVVQEHVGHAVCLTYNGRPEPRYRCTQGLGWTTVTLKLQCGMWSLHFDQDAYQQVIKCVSRAIAHTLIDDCTWCPV